MPNILPAPTRHVTPIEVIAVRGGESVARADRLVGEEPMEIRVAGAGQSAVSVAVTMRTPGHEDELAVGFLHSEGLVEGPDVVEVTFGDSPDVAQPDDIVTVHLSRPFDSSVVAARHFAATASCGVCGKAPLDEIEVLCALLPPGPIVRRDRILALPDGLRAGQDV